MSIQGGITLRNINKFYGKNHVVKNLDFEIYPGEFISLLGPSGCGKTTILRLIAGLEQLDAGEIYLDDKRIDALEPYKRNLNTIFQNYALFPHMNVRKNIEYGLRAKWMSKKEIKKKVDDIIELVQLKGFEDRMPNQMSGGQRQRVSIARAIVNEAPVVLLDEPLTALDLKLRKEMRFELRRLQKALQTTFVFVTHDQEEAIVMSDRIAVMNNGIIEQIGTPEEIYSKPKSQFVAQFIGETNVMEGMVSIDEKGTSTIQMEFGKALIDIAENFSDGELINLSIRPDMVKCSKEAEVGFEIPGKIVEEIFSGATTKYLVRLMNNKEITVSRLCGEESMKVDDIVYLSWKVTDATIMKSESQMIFGEIEGVDLSPWNNLI
ncbi:MAG TPA: spermidine/putrescine ABC transporter ATP-binding protein [Lachnospiraceae bacterium]|nr:spermidine/putrescine ABC transporter ATP-binding protein [Lachnospiraceae bacterium]